MAKERSWWQPSLRFTLFAVACAYLVSGCSLWRRAPAPVPEATPQAVKEARVSRAQEASMAPAPSSQWILEKYTDLPIPKGYTLLADESFVFMQGALRSADLKYRGHLKVADLIRFYQEAMPTNGWRFLRMTGVRMKTITFLKGGEICEILIMVANRKSEETHLNQGEEPVLTTHLHIKLNPN